MSFSFKFKIIIDAALTIFMLLSMGYHLTDNSTHEWLGTIFIALFLIHQIVNIRWYKNLNKGKYLKPRIILTTINFLLLFSVIITALSGICMSREVFFFLPRTSHLMFFQHIHMSATTWLFVLASCHLGIHWGIFINLFKKQKIIKQLFDFGYGKFIAVIIALYGLYQFISRRLAENFFLLLEYPVFDFYETYPLFLFDYLMIMSLFVCIFYFLQKF